ncbi:unnamed protein product [Closterium sp. NIES-65]|nr:unnamed protein product [Closterium sp. NIES-65]
MIDGQPYLPFKGTRCANNLDTSGVVKPQVQVSWQLGTDASKAACRAFDFFQDFNCNGKLLGSFPDGKSREIRPLHHWCVPSCLAPPASPPFLSSFPLLLSSPPFLSSFPLLFSSPLSPPPFLSSFPLCAKSFSLSPALSLHSRLHSLVCCAALWCRAPSLPSLPSSLRSRCAVPQTTCARM